MNTQMSDSSKQDGYMSHLNKIRRGFLANRMKEKAKHDVNERFSQDVGKALNKMEKQVTQAKETN